MTGKTIVGCDPGLSGAVCVLDDNELMAFRMPIFTYEGAQGKSKRKIDTIALKNILQDEKKNNPHVYIERVHAMPGQGVSSMFSMGFGCGIIEAAVMCCGLPLTYVTPQKWKKDLQVPADKDGARLRASQLMPQYAHNWSLKKDHGIAEAALIALWGMRQ